MQYTHPQTHTSNTPNVIHEHSHKERETSQGRTARLRTIWSADQYK